MPRPVSGGSITECYCKPINKAGQEENASGLYFASPQYPVSIASNGVLHTAQDISAYSGPGSLWHVGHSRKLCALRHNMQSSR
jgi:hypothetical protein